jgi:hypothetical protein
MAALTGLSALSGNSGIEGSSGAPALTSLQLYTARVNTAGGTVTSTKLSAVTTLLATLDAAGITSKIHYATLPCGPDTFTGAVAPLIDKFSLGNCTTNFVLGDLDNFGLKGSGKNLTTPYSPVAHGSNSSIHISTYASENKPAGFITLASSSDVNGTLQMYADTGYVVCNIFSDGGSRTVEFTAPMAGLIMGSRLNDTTHELRTPTGTGTNKLANSSSNTRENTLPAPNLVCIHPTVNFRVMFTSVGEGLTGAEYTILSNALDDYAANFIPNQSEVTAWVNNVVTAGGSVSTANRALVDRLVYWGKTHGWYNTIQRWYFPSGSDDLNGAVVPLKDSLTLGNFGNVGFTSSNWTTAGLKGTGTEYITTGFLPATHIVNPDSFNCTLEVTDYVTDGSYPQIVGSKDGTKTLTLYTSSAPDGGFELYDNTTNTGWSVALGNGSLVGNRSTSTSNRFYLNNSQVTANVATRTTLPPTLEMFFHARNVDGSVGGHSQCRILSIAVGSSQTIPQMTTMYYAMQTYKSLKGI